MKIHLTIYLTLLGIGILGCKSAEKNLVGWYKSNSHLEESSRIRFDPDHKFELIAYQGINYVGTKGSWQLKGKTLILNSDSIPRHRHTWQEGIIAFGELVKNNSITIEVRWCGDPIQERFTRKTSSLVGARVKLKLEGQWVQCETDNRGRIKLLNQYIDSIEVSAAEMMPLFESVGRKSIRNIAVMMVKQHWDTYSFNRETWYRKRNQIMKKGSNRKIVYRKVNKKESENYHFEFE